MHEERDPMEAVRAREKLEAAMRRRHPAHTKGSVSKTKETISSNITPVDGIDESRRRFVVGVGAASATALATAGLAGKLLENVSSANALPTPESLEQMFIGGFGKHIEGYTAMYGSLTRNQILFLDAAGAPLETISLTPVTIIENGENRVISPGVTDSNGFIPGDPGINQEWLDYHRQQLAERYNLPYEEGELPRQLNVIPMLRGAVENNPELLDMLIENSGIDPEYRIGVPMEDQRTEALNRMRFIDVVRFYATSTNQELGIGHQSALAYIRTHILDGIDTLPHPEMRDLWEEFPLLIPALAAQESQFNNDAESVVHARGIFQFIPSTWTGYGHSPHDIASLPKQVAGVDRHMREAYATLTGNEARTSLQKIETYFGSPTEFRKNFLLPVLINSYNSGPTRMVQVIHWFVNVYMPGRISETATFAGKDLYHLMTHTAALADSATTSGYELVSGYRKHSSEYVERIYALAGLVEEIT